MTDLVIFGAGQIAEVVDFYLEHEAGRRAAAFCVDDDYLELERLNDRPVVVSSRLGAEFPPEHTEAFVALSYSRMNRTRAAKAEWLQGLGYRLTSHVSPRAMVPSNVTVGWNALILEAAAIGPFSSIGDGATVWSGARVGHHVRVGDFAFLAGEAAVAGGVDVGSFSLIGTNATVRDHIRIGEYSLVGAGTTILHDTEPGSEHFAESSPMTGRSSLDRRTI